MSSVMSDEKDSKERKGRERKENSEGSYVFVNRTPHRSPILMSMAWRPVDSARRSNVIRRRGHARALSVDAADGIEINFNSPLILSLRADSNALDGVSDGFSDIAASSSDHSLPESVVPEEHPVAPPAVVGAPIISAALSLPEIMAIHAPLPLPLPPPLPLGHGIAPIPVVAPLPVILPAPPPPAVPVAPPALAIAPVVPAAPIVPAIVVAPAALPIAPVVPIAPPLAPAPIPPIPPPPAPVPLIWSPVKKYDSIREESEAIQNIPKESLTQSHVMRLANLHGI